MARYFEDAKLFASLIKDKNRLKAQIANSSPIVQIGKRSRPSIKVEIKNIKVTTRDVSSDTIWGQFNWGAANWDGSYTSSKVEVIKRKWFYENYTELSSGTKSASMSISNGDLRIQK